MRYDYSLLFALAAVGVVVSGRQVATRAVASAASDAPVVKAARCEDPRPTGLAERRPAEGAQ